MKGIAIADVRNFVFLGHTGSGKTTLVDALLYKLGVNDRQGSPDDGSSMSDWMDEEKERQISIWTKPFDAQYKTPGGKNMRLVFMDTPGYADFFGQVVAASSVADAAVMVVDAASGIQVGSNRGWRRCEELSLPRAIVITGLDKDNTDYDATLAAIQDVWGARCVPFTLPAADGSVVNVMSAKDAGDLQGRIDEIKGSLIETAAESDDALIEKYLGGEELSTEEISEGLKGAVFSGNLVPVYVVNPKAATGIDDLLQGISNMFPSPLDREVKDADGEVIDPSDSSPMTSLVWRSVNDPFVGQLTFLRVFSGTLKADSEIDNLQQDQKERYGALYLIRGKKQETIDEAHAGDIVAIAKLKHTHLNQTLAEHGCTRKLPEIVFPKPVMAYAVMPKTQGDEDKLGTGLHRLAEEDPTLHVERNAETHELVFSGMGDVHLDVAVHRLKTKNNVEVDLSTPKVAYKETVTSSGEGHYKHKKQSGGRGQYGEVYLRLSPRDPSDEEWFVNNIVGGAIPTSFIPAVEKGLVEGMNKGALAGYPVTNVKISVYDGSYHDVDSSEVAFKIAASRALREGMLASKPVLLEPIMKIKVMIPDSYLGDVNGDLNHRRGRILGMGAEDGMQVIEAEVPQSEVFQYSSQLRSMTGGRGSFEMEFLRYDTVPSNVAQKVIAEAKHEVEEDE